jgi:hypothetical protein
VTKLQSKNYSMLHWSCQYIEGLKPSICLSMLPRGTSCLIAKSLSCPSTPMQSTSTLNLLYHFTLTSLFMFLLELRFLSHSVLGMSLVFPCFMRRDEHG